MAKQDSQFRVFQVVCPKPEARRIERYCKRKGVPWSRFFREVALMVVNAAEARTQV